MHSHQRHIKQIIIIIIVFKCYHVGFQIQYIKIYNIPKATYYMCPTTMISTLKKSSH